MDTIRFILASVSYAGGLIFAVMLTWFVVEKNVERLRYWLAARRGRVVSLEPRRR